MAKTKTLSQAVDKVVEKMRGVMTRKEIIDAVLKLYHSNAKNPGSSIMNELRWRKEIVKLGNAQYARVDWVIDGAKFRIKVEADDMAQGGLSPKWFVPFDQVMTPVECTFVAADGELIPFSTRTFDFSKLTNEELKSMLTNLQEHIQKNPLLALELSSLLPFDQDDQDDEDDEDDEDWEDEWDDDLEDEWDDEEMNEEEVLNQARELLKEKVPPQEVKYHDLTDFYRKHEVQVGDSLIVTVRPKQKSYVFEHEPAAKVQEFLIKQRDKEMRDFIHRAIARNQRESAREVIFSAYGIFAWLKEYPSSPWMQIVEDDDDLRLVDITGNNLEIASIDFRTMFDVFGVDESTKRKLSKRRSGIEQEIDDFLDRYHAALDQLTDRMIEGPDWGGPPNLVSRSRRPRSHKKVLEYDDKLIDQFFENQKKKKGKAAAEKKAVDISMLADFLIDYCDQLMLDCVSLDDLLEFLFEWYPRKVLNSSPTQARELAENIRDFYLYLVEAKVIHSAAFANGIYSMRELAAEKVDLYHRLPMEDSNELLQELFEW